MSITEVREVYPIKDNMSYNAIKAYNRKLHDDKTKDITYDTNLKERYSEFAQSYLTKYKKMPSRSIQEHMKKYMLEHDFLNSPDIVRLTDHKAYSGASIMAQEPLSGAPFVGASIMAQEPIGQYVGGQKAFEFAADSKHTETVKQSVKRKPGRPRKDAKGATKGGQIIGMYDHLQYPDATALQPATSRSMTGSGKILLKDKF